MKQALTTPFIAIFLLAAASAQAGLPECIEPAVPPSASEEKAAQQMIKTTYQSMIFAGYRVFDREADLTSWFTAISKVKIRFVDSDLLTSVDGIFQNGTAYSCENLRTNEMFTFLNRNRWANIHDQASQEALIHHEIAVLAGLENTGDYTYTERFFRLRQNNYMARTALDSLSCQLSLFDKSNNALLNQKTIQLESFRSIYTVQLTGKNDKDGLYARVVGDAGMIADINLISGKPVGSKRTGQSILGHDLLKKELLKNKPEGLADWVLHGYGESLSGEFSKFFDADSYLFQVTCKSTPKQ